MSFDVEVIVIARVFCLRELRRRFICLLAFRDAYCNRLGEASVGCSSGREPAARKEEAATVYDRNLPNLFDPLRQTLSFHLTFGGPTTVKGGGSRSQSAGHSVSRQFRLHPPDIDAAVMSSGTEKVLINPFAALVEADTLQYHGPRTFVQVNVLLSLGSNLLALLSAASGPTEPRINRLHCAGSDRLT